MNYIKMRIAILLLAGAVKLMAGCPEGGNAGVVVMHENERLELHNHQRPAPNDILNSSTNNSSLDFNPSQIDPSNLQDFDPEEPDEQE